MLEKASNAKKILMLFMSENAKNYAGLFYRWLLTGHVMALFSSSVGRAHFFDVMLVIRAKWIKFPRLNHAVKPVYPLVMTCALVTNVAVCIVLSFCSTMTSAGRSNEYNLGR